MLVHFLLIFFINVKIRKIFRPEPNPISVYRLIFKWHKKIIWAQALKYINTDLNKIFFLISNIFKYHIKLIMLLHIFVVLWSICDLTYMTYNTVTVTSQKLKKVTQFFFIRNIVLKCSCPIFMYWKSSHFSHNVTLLNGDFLVTHVTPLSGGILFIHVT